MSHHVAREPGLSFPPFEHREGWGTHFLCNSRQNPNIKVKTANTNAEQWATRHPFCS